MLRSMTLGRCSRTDVGCSADAIAAFKGEAHNVANSNEPANGHTEYCQSPLARLSA
jgi:hypothetical protein